ncbi:MAG: cell division protein FtsA, partial [Thermodesulfobacteriota bacterium]
FGYSCMAISWGAGLTNVGMANEIWEIDSFKFSVSRGGDYIDKGVSDSLRIPITRVIVEKEGNRKKEIPRLDLTNPRNEIQVALKYFYKSYINYVLDLIHAKFFTLKTTVPLPNSIPIICSGGSALPKGFIELVKEGVFGKRNRLPFEVSDVILAKSPLTATAKGLRIKLEMDNA